MHHFWNLFHKHTPAPPPVEPKTIPFKTVDFKDPEIYRNYDNPGVKGPVRDFLLKLTDDPGVRQKTA